MTRGRLVMLGLVTVATAACPGESSVTPAPSTTPTVPADWAGRTNPLPEDAATIAIGRVVFLKNCAPCHGPEADGKGIASAGLSPPPANFREGRRLSSKKDDFVFWRISTGIPGSAMPAFSGTTSEEERWAMLRFLRSLPGGRLEEEERK